MNPLISALTNQLQSDPSNWLVRAQLAEILHEQDQNDQAVQILLAAPSLPTNPEHLQKGSQILMGSRPDVAMSYLTALSGQAAAAAATSPTPKVRSMSSPVAKAPAGQTPVTITPTKSVSNAPSAGYGQAHLADPDVPLEAGIKRPRRIGGPALVGSIILHGVLVVAALFWVVSKVFTKSKEGELSFIAEPPSASANKKAGKDVKMAKKKKTMGGAPNAKRITSSAISKISLPETPTSSMSDFAPGRMGGAGMGGLGLGTGTGGPGGGMGGGMGGGRIKFFGFEGDSSNIILAIDVSGSMRSACGPEGIKVLKEEIAKTIDLLTPISKFNIITFGQDCDICFPANVPATKANKDTAKAFMDGYYGDKLNRTRTEALPAPEKSKELAELDGIKFTPLLANKVKGLEGTSGGSRMDLAVVAAMERGAASIFVVSDGAPGTARGGEKLNPDDLIKLLKENQDRLFKNKPLTINTIFTNQSDAEEDFMKSLARKFSGKFKRVDLKKKDA